ncbi:unnamed protein product [Penicillium olsonii]|nr:unnamed protein product [Penicillium olsonii]
MCTRRCSQACLGQCRHRHTNLRLLSARTFRDSDVVSVLSFQSHLPVVRTVAMVHHRVIYFLSSLSSLLLLLLLLSPPCLWLFICSACTALDSCLPLAFFLLLLSFFFPFPFSLFSFFFFSFPPRCHPDIPSRCSDGSTTRELGSPQLPSRELVFLKSFLPRKSPSLGTGLEFSPPDQDPPSSRGTLGIGFLPPLPPLLDIPPRCTPMMWHTL